MQLSDHSENVRNLKYKIKVFQSNYLKTKKIVDKIWKNHHCNMIYLFIYYSRIFEATVFQQNRTKPWGLPSQARSAAEVKRAEQRPLAAADVHRCFPSVTLLRLREDLSSYKVDRVL